MRRPFAIASVALAAAAFGAAFACDPVHNDKVSSLGGEAPGVRTGPLHRPGEPCTECHDGSLGNPPAFSVAGTLFQTADATTALSGATVTITAADGKTYATTSNEAGNFYVTPNDFAPKFPIHVNVTSGGTTVTMQSHVGWASSCATCHVDPAGPDSPGHVYFDVPDGAVP
jgi:hypothetical protein